MPLWVVIREMTIQVLGKGRRQGSQASVSLGPGACSVNSEDAELSPVLSPAQLWARKGGGTCLSRFPSSPSLWRPHLFCEEGLPSQLWHPAPLQRL